MATIGLFIPCYVDQLFPQVGIASLRILKNLGLDVEVPVDQTCCGQPMANSGCADSARPLAERFLRLFARYDHVVAPSGSCISMVKNHYAQGLSREPGFERLRTSAYELCEYLVDVVGVRNVDGELRHKVGLHQSCHGLRELRLGRSSERRDAPFNKVRDLLVQLRGIELVALTRPDECCGFGGTFAVAEEAVSSMMGRDRIADHRKAGAELIAGADMSCLMHLDGLMRRDGMPIPVVHVAQLLQEARLS